MPKLWIAALALLTTPAAALAEPIHQLRIYEMVDDKKPIFHARFRDHALRIMARHGFRVLTTWETANAGKTEFAYLLEWPDEATMTSRWAAFMADREWAEIKAATRARHGPIMGAIEDRILRPTGYSPARPPSP